MTAVSVVVAVYVSCTTPTPELTVSLKTILDVEPEAKVAVALTIVEVADVDKLYQQEAEPLVSDEPVLQIEPLSKNFCARSDVVLAETV